VLKVKVNIFAWLCCSISYTSLGSCLVMSEFS